MGDNETKAISLNPQVEAKIAETFAKVRILFEQGNLEEASKIFSQATAELDKLTIPTGQLLLQKIAGLDFLRGDKKSLFTHLKQFGQYLFENSVYKSAQEVFQTALAIDPDDKECGYQVAKMIISSGDLPFGLAQLRKVVESDHENKDALELLISTSVKHRPEAALTYINSYLKLDPCSVVSYRNIIRLYEVLGMQTESVNMRVKMMDLIENPDELQSHILDSEHLYPNEPSFHVRNLEMMISSGNFENADSELSKLSQIYKKAGDLKSALIYTELRLLVDPQSERLVEEADEIRSILALRPTPFKTHKSKVQYLHESKRSLLSLDFNSYLNSISKALQDALIDCDNNLVREIRIEQLYVLEFKSLIESKFDGPRSTSEEVWAKLLRAYDTKELSCLRKEHPSSLPVLSKYFESVKGNVAAQIETWIELAESAINHSDLDAVSSYISLLSATIPSLAMFIPRLRPILAATTSR